MYNPFISNTTGRRKLGSESWQTEAGFSLVEVVVSMGVAAVALLGLYSSEQQAARIARAGRAVASASEMLQERIEAFRYAPPWTNVTTAAGIASVAAGAPAVAANFNYASETFTVQGYPGGSQLIVTRSPTGTFSTNGVDLSSSRCVKLTITTSWLSTGNISRTRQVSTIITRGGI